MHKGIKSNGSMCSGLLLSRHTLWDQMHKVCTDLASRSATPKLSALYKAPIMIHSDGAAIHHGAIDVLHCSFSILACKITDKAEATWRFFGGIQTHDKPFYVPSFGK